MTNPVAVTITCPACGDTHASPDGDPDYLSKHVTRCSACAARIVYGKVAPRVVVEPGTFDTPFGSQPAMIVRIQDQVTKADLHVLTVDPQHSFLITQAIISLVRP